MCGIGCFIGKRTFSEDEMKDTLRVMNDTHHHRGPDSSGWYIDRTVGLCHTRLSIIDLSEKAGQPFISEDKNYIIVYNGEVYNFREIKEELEKNGAYFSTESDTEVVLQAYISWGTESFIKFNGMFAFILYDKKEGKLIVARDRAGIKSLHFYSDNECIIIASEVKAILKLLKKYSCRSQALHDILLRRAYRRYAAPVLKISLRFNRGSIWRSTWISFHCSMKTYCDLLARYIPVNTGKMPLSLLIRRSGTSIR